MLERLDENARVVFARARDEARALGRECIDTEHVLLGLCHYDAKDSDPVLAPAGITAQSVRAWLAQHGGQRGGAPDGSLPFTPNVWFVLYQTHVEADGRQHQSIGPAHVLLALIRCASLAPEAGRQPVQTSPPDPDVVAAMLRDCEIDLRALHARAAARANTDRAGHGFPFLGACSRLPGRGRRWLWRGAVLAGYAPFAALEIVLAPATRVIALAAAVIAPIGLYLVMDAVARPQWRRRMAREDVEPIEAPGLRAALVPAGLRELKVLCDPRGRFTGRSRGAARRFGGVGMIFLRSSLKKAHPDLTRFITAHEAAHLASDDVMSQGLAVACLGTLIGVSVATRPADILWLYLPAIALIVTLSWAQELACDRVAVHTAGRIPAEEYLAYLGRADARRRSRPLLTRIRAQLRARRTHPPGRMRRGALERTIAKASAASLGRGGARHTESVWTDVSFFKWWELEEAEAHFRV